MKKLTFTTNIKASKDKVWNTLWDDQTYREWTSVFCEGSHAVSDWQEGSKILFLAGDGGGMASVIAKKEPNTFMSFKHLAEVKDNVELPIDEKTKTWSGATENYTLKEKDGSTGLTVELDIVEDHASYFNETFPKALEKLKGISEK